MTTWVMSPSLVIILHFLLQLASVSSSVVAKAAAATGLLDSRAGVEVEELGDEFRRVAEPEIFVRGGCISISEGTHIGSPYPLFNLLLQGIEAS